MGISTETLEVGVQLYFIAEWEKHGNKLVSLSLESEKDWMPGELADLSEDWSRS